MSRRSLLLASSVALLAACGGGSSKSSNPVGSGASLAATGTIPFTATNATWATGGKTCASAGVSFGFAWAALAASDQSGICGYLQANEDKQNARTITVVVLALNANGPMATVGAGSYPIVANPTTSDSAYAFVSVGENDAACQATDVTATGGTVTVTSIANGRLQGSVSATLSDGGAVTGSFDAQECSVTFPGDACSGLIGPQNPTCAP